MNINKLGARHCAFCGKTHGCVGMATSILEALGGKSGNGYAHLACVGKARRTAISSAKPQLTPIEQLVSILQQNQFVDAMEVLVPEQCATISLFGKNLHITVQEVEG